MHGERHCIPGTEFPFHPILVMKTGSRKSRLVDLPSLPAIEEEEGPVGTMGESLAHLGLDRAQAVFIPVERLEEAGAFLARFAQRSGERGTWRRSSDS